MRSIELSEITVRFAEPTHGYWDGGAKSEGVFTPTLRRPESPHESYVKWGCYELNYWFNQPLHTKKGRTLTRNEAMTRARRHLRNGLRVPAAVI